MNWLSLVSIFAKPLGAMINKGLAAAAAAVVGYGISKGWDATSLTMITSEVVVALSTIISGVAASQGVQIPIINQDPSNGVKVVSANSPSAAVNAPGK